MTSDPQYRPARWLTHGQPEGSAERIVRVAQCCVGMLEEGGANRGPEIDAWLRWVHYPEDLLQKGLGYWCAAFAARMWYEGGMLDVPKTASCDALLAWGRKTNRFTEHAPSIGALVLYGKWDHPTAALKMRSLVSKTDAVHVGIIARVSPAIVSFEGNTTVEGSRLERNGTAVACKLVTPEDPVIGFVHVHPSK